MSRIKRLELGFRTPPPGRGRVARPSETPDTPDQDSAAGRRRRLKAFKSFGFVAAAATVESLPASTGPEVAIAGRSNVGKSTLVNTLTTKPLARVSDAPGHTKTLNFYELLPPAGRNQTMSLVDMPGYGFAHARAETIAGWAELMKYYLEERTALRRVLLLLDGRHGIKEIDRQFLDYLDAVLPSRVKVKCVLTKCDLVRPADLGRRVTVVENELATYKRTILDVGLISRRSIPAMEALQTELHSLAAPRSHPPSRSQKRRREAPR